MPDSAPPSSLQFDEAELPAGAARQSCASCKLPLTKVYFAVNGIQLCTQCKQMVLQQLEGGSKLERVLRSVGVGLGAALAGAAVWWGIRKATGYELALISIGIGMVVGRGIRWGNRRRGGLGYQLLAVALTYLSISFNYLPDLIEAVTDKGNEVHLFGGIFLAAFSLSMPVRIAFESPISILIIGFGLWEAFKSNRPRVIHVEGPLQVATAAAPATPADPATAADSTMASAS